MSTYRRYVAIGDSATEGLQDFDEDGGYRGWADRLAEHIADAQDEPLEYANLGIRSLRMHEIRQTQFEAALTMEPDLLSITGGVNDVLEPKPEFDRVEADYRAMFGAAAERGITTFTFLMPDPGFLNPIGRYFRGRTFRLNEIVGDIARQTGALVLDLGAYPLSSDPRLWYEDGLHGNWLGHTLMAQAFANLLGLPGFEHWSDPLPGPPPHPHSLERIGSDLDWAVHWFAPWLGRGIVHHPHGRGITAKRPLPVPVLPRVSRSANAGHPGH